MGVASPWMGESVLIQSKNKTEAQPCDGCEMDLPPPPKVRKRYLQILSKMKIRSQNGKECPMCAPWPSGSAETGRERKVCLHTAGAGRGQQTSI